MKIISIFRCITCQTQIAQSEFGLTQEVYDSLREHLEVHPLHELAQRFAKEQE